MTLFTSFISVTFLLNLCSYIDNFLGYLIIMNSNKKEGSQIICEPPSMK